MTKARFRREYIPLHKRFRELRKTLGSAKLEFPRTAAGDRRRRALAEEWAEVRRKLRQMYNAHPQWADEIGGSNLKGRLPSSLKAKMGAEEKPEEPVDLFKWVGATGGGGLTYRGGKPWGFPSYKTVEDRASQLARLWAQTESQRDSDEWVIKNIMRRGDLPVFRPGSAEEATIWVNDPGARARIDLLWQDGFKPGQGAEAHEIAVRAPNIYRAMAKLGLAGDDYSGTLKNSTTYVYASLEPRGAGANATPAMPLPSPLVDKDWTFRTNVRGKRRGQETTPSEIQKALIAYLKIYALPNVLGELVQYARNLLDKAIEQIRERIAEEQGEERFKRLTQLWSKTARKLYGASLDSVVAVDKGGPGQPDTEYLLFSCQQEAIWWMLEAHRGILAHDMGLGKTLSSLTAFNIMQQGLPGFQVDIVAPNAGLLDDVWKQEAYLFPTLQARYSYPTAITKLTPPLPREKRPQGFGIIFDEGHFYQNLYAQRTLGALDMVQGNIMKPSLVLTRSKVGLGGGMGWENKIELVENDQPFPVIGYSEASLATGSELVPAINIVSEIRDGLETRLALVRRHLTESSVEFDRPDDLPVDWFAQALVRLPERPGWTGDGAAPRTLPSRWSASHAELRQTALKSLETRLEKLLSWVPEDSPSPSTTRLGSPTRTFAWKTKKIRLLAEYVHATGPPVSAAGPMLITDKQAQVWISKEDVAKKKQGDGLRTPVNIVKMFNLTEQDFRVAELLHAVDSWVTQNDVSNQIPVLKLGSAAWKAAGDGRQYTPWRAPIVGNPETIPAMGVGPDSRGYLPRALAAFAIIQEGRSRGKVRSASQRATEAGGYYGRVKMVLLYEQIIKRLYHTLTKYRLNLDSGATGRFASQADFRTVPMVTRLTLLVAAKDGGGGKGALKSAVSEYNRAHQKLYRNPHNTEAYKDGDPPFAAKDRIHNPDTGVIPTVSLARLTESMADYQYWWQRGGDEPISVVLLTGTPLKNANPDQLWPLLKLILSPLTQLNIVYDEYGNRKIQTPGQNLDAFRRRFIEAGLEGGILYLHENLSDKGPNADSRGSMLWRSKNARHELLLAPVLDADGNQLYETDLAGNRVPKRWYSTDQPFCLPGLGDKERHFIRVKARPAEEAKLAAMVAEAIRVYEEKVEEDDRDPTTLGKVGTALTKTKETMAIIKVPATVALAIKFLQAGEKVVIFTDSRKASEDLAEALTKWLTAQNKGYRPALLMTGDVDPPDRKKQKNLFQNDKRYRVFVLMYVVGSTGYTLTAAARMILNDRPWQPADIRQAEDRIYRIGQHRNPRIYWIQLPAGPKRNRTVGSRVYQNITFEETLDLRNLSKITAMEQLLAGEVMGGLEADVEYESTERRENEEIIAHKEKEPTLDPLQLINPRRPMRVEQEHGGVAFLDVGTLKSTSLAQVGQAWGSYADQAEFESVNVVAIQRMNKAAWLRFFEEKPISSSPGNKFLATIMKDVSDGRIEAPLQGSENAVRIQTAAMLPDIYVQLSEPDGKEIVRVVTLGLAPGCGEQCDIKSPGWSDLAGWYKDAKAPSVKVEVVPGEMAAYTRGMSASRFLRPDKQFGPLSAAGLSGEKLRRLRRSLVPKVVRLLTDRAGPIEHGRGIWKPETFVKIARETRRLPQGTEVLYKVQSVLFGKPQEPVILVDPAVAADLFLRLSRPIDLMMQPRLEDTVV